MLFRRALSRISCQNFIPDSHAKSLQLRLSTEFLSIVEEIRQNDSLIFQVYGEPGSGCSTLVQGICQHLCEINHITKEILYLSLNRYCNEKSLWDFMSNLAKETHDKEHATFFSATSVKKDKKIKKFLGFFNFKVICFDNADCNEDLVNLFLKHLVSSKIKTFIISTQTKQIQTNGRVSTIEVRGLNLSTAQKLFRRLCPSHSYEDRQISSLCKIFKYNPVAIKLFCALVNSPKLNKHVENLLKDLTDDNTTQHQCKDKRQVDMLAVDWILDYIKQSLEPSNINILYQLCHLRRPLPVTELKPEVSKLIELNLLTMKEEGSVKIISIDSSLQKHLSCRRDNKTAKEPAGFSVLECWLSLVSDKLQGFVQDAEENAWPFVEEKWQFVEEVDKGENYNVQDLLTSKNLHIPSLTEIQILQECLYHAYIEGSFKKMAALVMVLDRFLYRQGEGRTSMDIVDYIQKESPKTAIAPQLVIRKVRLMKDNGNLREAEKTLDNILENESKLGEWEYKDEHQYHLVSGACYQVKGEIQYGLGHWITSASLLMKSIGYFESLPRRDKKGLALSYGLLCLCLRNMTMKDYTDFARNFNLFECHPLLAAYFSSQEAAEWSSYTPLFFLRHTCRAGEVLLEYLNLIHDKNEKQHLLRIAIEDLKDSIQAHQSYASLTSREQFYLLVCAVYKISLALFQIGSDEDKEKGVKLKDLSTELYEHYFSSNDRVPINKDMIEMVDQCLSLLGLEAFSKDNLVNAAEVLVNYSKKRKAVRQSEDSRLFSVGFFDNLNKHEIRTTNLKKSKITEQELRIHVLKKTVDPFVKKVGMPEEQDTHRAHPGKSIDEGSVDKCTDTAEMPEEQDTCQAHPGKSLEEGSVDKCADAAEMAEEQDTCRAHPGKSLEEGSVDKCADAAEMPEEQDVCRAHPGKSLDEGTIDRCADTAEMPEEQDTCQAHPGKSLDEGTIDRCADTAEMPEEQDTCRAHPGKSLDEGTVDRCADTAEMLKEEQAHQTFSATLEKLASMTMEEGEGIVLQSLENEAASLPSPTMDMFFEIDEFSVCCLRKEANSKTNQVKDAILWKYNSVTSQWREQPTMVYIGEQLELATGKEGSQRDVYAVGFINQDDERGRYVAKRYRQNKTMQQYQNDVLSQMTAKQYVAWFNQQLYEAAAGVPVGDIQFLPVVLLQLVTSDGQTEIFNAEPYMSGEFIKLTNNTDWKNIHRSTDLVLAYSHFTYKASGGKLIIVDIQGWAPLDNQGCTYLTDPQIHSTDYKCFGTGNFGKEGYDNFWKMHSECNEICKMLGLERPNI